MSRPKNSMLVRRLSLLVQRARRLKQEIELLRAPDAGARVPMSELLTVGDLEVFADKLGDGLTLFLGLAKEQDRKAENAGRGQQP